MQVLNKSPNAHLHAVRSADSFPCRLSELIHSAASAVRPPVRQGDMHDVVRANSQRFAMFWTGPAAQKIESTTVKHRVFVPCGASCFSTVAPVALKVLPGFGGSEGFKCPKKQMSSVMFRHSVPYIVAPKA